MPPSAFLAGFAPGFIDAQSALMNNQLRQAQTQQILSQMAQQQKINQLLGSQMGAMAQQPGGIYGALFGSPQAPQTPGAGTGGGAQTYSPSFTTLPSPPPTSQTTSALGAPPTYSGPFGTAQQSPAPTAPNLAQGGGAGLGMMPPPQYSGPFGTAQTAPLNMAQSPDGTFSLPPQAQYSSPFGTAAAAPPQQQASATSQQPQLGPSAAAPATPSQPAFMNMLTDTGQADGGGAAPGGFNAGYQTLLSLGVSPDVARGAIAYMARNESPGGPSDVNPQSGAFGRAQWLGPRKTALTSQFGAQPSDPQQAQFMRQELTGPESGTLASLRNATTAKQGYDIWGSQYERPGTAALAEAGVKERQAAFNSLDERQQNDASDLATMTAGMLPPTMIGRTGPGIFARLVERIAGSSADDETKGAVLMKLLPLMSQEGQQQYTQAWDQTKFAIEERDKQRDFLIRQQDLQANRQFNRILAGERLDLSASKGQLVTVNGELYRDTPDGLVKVAVPGAKPGAPEPTVTKVGTPGTSQGRWSPDAMEALVDRTMAGDPHVMSQLPRSGPARQQYEEALAARLKQSPGGIAGGTAQLVMNQLRMSEARSAAQTAGRVTMNTALFSHEAEGAAKLVVDASKGVPRTNLPTINQIEEAGLTHVGDPNVVRLGVAINALLNAYGKMSNPTGTGIHDADKARLEGQLTMFLSQGQIEAGVDQIVKEGINLSQAAQDAQIQVMAGLAPQVPGAAPATGGTQRPGGGAGGGATPAAPGAQPHIRLDDQGNEIP